jgi:hypothetical protein
MDSNLVNTNSTSSTHPYYSSVTKNSPQMQGIVNRPDLTNGVNMCKRSLWIYCPWKNAPNKPNCTHNQLHIISPPCNATARTNVGFSTDQHPLFWVHVPTEMKPSFDTKENEHGAYFFIMHPHEGTNSQNSVLLHNLWHRVHEPINANATVVTHFVPMMHAHSVSVDKFYPLNI